MLMANPLLPNFQICREPGEPNSMALCIILGTWDWGSTGPIRAHRARLRQCRTQSRCMGPGQSTMESGLVCCHLEQGDMGPTPGVPGGGGTGPDSGTPGWGGTGPNPKPVD